MGGREGEGGGGASGSATISELSRDVAPYVSGRQTGGWWWWWNLYFQSQTDNTIKHNLLPRICSRTRMGCFVPPWETKGGVVQQPVSDLSVW